MHTFRRLTLQLSAYLSDRTEVEDTKVDRGRITKQGNMLLRWAAEEAVQMLRTGPIGHSRVHICERRGANIGKGRGRKLLSLVF